MQIRRDKGLCYFCDEKFSYSHKCPNKQMMMLQLEDSDSEEASDTSDKSVNNQDAQHGEHHLSLNAMRGINGVGTIRFIARIDNIEVQILLDGGSSDFWEFFATKDCSLLKVTYWTKAKF